MGQKVSGNPNGCKPDIGDVGNCDIEYCCKGFTSIQKNEAGFEFGPACQGCKHYKTDDTFWCVGTGRGKGYNRIKEITCGYQ